jgi:hypothetical protein
MSVVAHSGSRPTTERTLSRVELFDQPFWRCSLPEPATVIKKLKEKTRGF